MKIGSLNVFEFIDFLKSQKPVLNFLNLVSSRSLLSCQPFSHKKTCIMVPDTISEDTVAFKIQK